jgi:hypothetical protein
LLNGFTKVTYGKKFENISELTTREEYDRAMSYVIQLIREATVCGALSDPEADNEYIREIGRAGRLCAAYEDTQIVFKHLDAREKISVNKRHRKRDVQPEY